MHPKAAPTELATRDDIIWFAGIFEGDGNASKTSTEIVCVGQKERWLLDKCRALFGGSVHLRERQGFDKRANHYMWQVTGARARGLLQSIYGLLSPRRQAQVEETLR